jgi:DNA-binding PadR family transcriptional regulator
MAIENDVDTIIAISDGAVEDEWSWLEDGKAANGYALTHQGKKILAAWEKMQAGIFHGGEQ